MALVIYTDGSCNPNPGMGGWAYVIPSLGIEKSGHEPDTTNNRMEMRAILEALRDHKDAPHVLIYSDSQLCINVLTGRWKAKKNTDLIPKALFLQSVGFVLPSQRNGVSSYPFPSRSADARETDR